MSEALELLKKLKALAEQGVGGEKSNAEAMLAKTLKKHGMTLEDLEGEKVVAHSMRVVKADWSLFFQVHGHIFGKKASIWRSKVAGYKIFDATNSDFLLFEATYEFYKRQLKVEQKRLYTAFVMKHKIYPKDGDVIDPKDLTKKELQDLLRASEMASSLKDVTMKKLIPQASINK